MLTHNFSYEDCLKNSLKVAWKVDDVLGGKNFDFSKRFLPNKLTGVDGVTCLNDDEKRKLNQIIGNSYCHIFAFVEEFILADILNYACRDVFGDEVRLHSLLRFAEEEVKHQTLFKNSIKLFNEGFGSPCELIGGREEVAKVVLSKSPLCVLLLTNLIEWFTQLHYVEHIKDTADLDPLFLDLLKFHWLDEAQHAKIDTLLAGEVAKDLTLEQRETAVDEMLELGGAIDGLVAQQMELDITSLETALGRELSDADKNEIRKHVHKALRWTYLVSGMQHPNFQKIIAELTEKGPDKIAGAVEALSA